MKIFSKKNTVSKKSLEAFKASAASISADDAVNAITGGTMSRCHNTSVGSVFDNYTATGGILR